MRTTFLAPLLLLAACDCDCDDDHDPGLPLFQEAEPNDTALTANHFGIIRPGDHFLIQGFVRDDAADPFDGFAFTAESALHVDFQLFIDTNTADFDVDLYDPQLDQVVATFATPNNPEVGGVDVAAGGLDFHLVLSSFAGDGPYTLEISVQSLFLTATAAELSVAPKASISAVNARADHLSRSADDYLREKPVKRPLVEIEQRFEFDRKSGTVLAITRVRAPADS